MAKNLILGIDIGTTSVKTCIVDPDKKEKIAIQKKDTSSDVPSEFGFEGSKQNVPRIIAAFQMCISRLPKELLRRVHRIGVCGQMHGCLMWKQSESWEKKPDIERYEVRNVSDLYTWQDNRCTKDFLEQLPVPTSHTPLSSGYGCVTLLWFAKYKSEVLTQYDRAGTVHDFLVAMLCDLNIPVMSIQNAVSWGYFNLQKKDWDYDKLNDSGLSPNFLPKVVSAGECAGRLSCTWYGIPEGTPILASLGDLQCSVYPLLNSLTDAAVNISTSAQICFQLAKDFKLPSEPPAIPNPIDYIPYFDGRYLAVAASLNGGNTLAAFVRMLQQWCIELGFQVPQSTLWEKIVALGSSANSESFLNVVPTMFGERHSPERAASVSNINSGNTSLGTVTKSLCSGIVKNLHSMMPRSLLLDNGITRIIGGGSALVRNPILQSEMQAVYDLPLVLEARGSASFGAALVAMEMKMD